MQVFFIIYMLKQNYKQFELETADITTVMLITLLLFPTELLYSNKARFAPQPSWCCPCSSIWVWSNCEHTQFSIWPLVSVWPGLTSDQTDAKLFLFENSNIDISWGEKLGWLADFFLFVWLFALFFLFSGFDFSVSNIPLSLFFFSLLKPFSVTPECYNTISNFIYKNEISSKTLMWFKFQLGNCILFFERLIFWPWKKSEKYLKTGIFWR